MSNEAHVQHAAAEGFHAPHVVPAAVFGKVIGALLVLTILTVVASRFHFGSMNMFIAMAISAVKASLVMTFFMHLKWDTAINNITIISSFLFLSLLFIFTLADVATREDVDAQNIERPGNLHELQKARFDKLGGLDPDEH